MKTFSSLTKIFESGPIVRLPKEGSTNHPNYEDGITEAVYDYSIEIDLKENPGYSATPANVVAILNATPNTSVQNAVDTSNGQIPLLVITVPPATTTKKSLVVTGQIYTISSSALKSNTLKSNLKKLKLYNTDAVVLNAKLIGSTTVSTQLFDANASSVNKSSQYGDRALIGQVMDKSTLTGYIWQGSNGNGTPFMTFAARISQFYKIQNDQSSGYVTFEINKGAGDSAAFTPIAIILNKLFPDPNAGISKKTGYTSVQSQQIDMLYQSCGDPAYSSKRAPNKIDNQEAYNILCAAFVYCLNLSLVNSDDTYFNINNAVPGSPRYGIVEPALTSLFKDAQTEANSATDPAPVSNQTVSQTQGSTADGTSINTEDELVKIFSGYLKEKGLASMPADEIKKQATFQKIAKRLPFKKGDAASTTLALLQRMLFASQKRNVGTGPYGDITTAAVKQAYADSTL